MPADAAPGEQYGVVWAGARVAGRAAAPLDTVGPPVAIERSAVVVDLRPTVLICDDEPDIRLLYSTVMEAKGAMVVVADGDECLRVADQFRAMGAVEGIEKLGMIARIPELIERYGRSA